LSILLVDLRQAVGHGLTIRPIRTMMNHATTELFFDDLEVPIGALVGEEGHGFRYLLDGLNAERILIAAECVGDGRWFVDRATRYAKDRIVFGRPIGQNQGVQFPIARAHVNVEAADLMRIRAAELFDRREPCGAEANIAKPRAADATVKGLSSYFVWLNRSKQSLALDLKRPEARGVLDRLLARADVFVQNLAPGAVERLGAAPAGLRARYPRLIVCSISGYGSSGP